MEPDTALAICRFLHDGSTMALWGALAFLWALVPPGLAEVIGQRFSRLRSASIAVAVVTTFASLPLEAAAIGNGWSDALDPATLRAILLETSVGAAWSAQAAAALLLAATLALSPRTRPSMTTLASGLLLVTSVLAGHASMHEGMLGAAHRLNDAIHLLAGGAWLGALIALRPLLRSLDDNGQSREAGIALRRFSTAGHVAVAIVIATGVVNTVLVLGRWPTDWSSPYQVMLAAKIIVVLAMTMLALANRYVLVPRMACSPEAALRALRWGTVAEIGLGLVVVGLVSSFGLLEPL